MSSLRLDPLGVYFAIASLYSNTTVSLLRTYDTVGIAASAQHVDEDPCTGFVSPFDKFTDALKRHLKCFWLMHHCNTALVGRKVKL